jgi:DNA polymerase-3 subunit delta
VVVKDAELLDENEQLERYIHNPPKTTVLVLQVKGKPSEKIQHAVRERGRVINFWPLFPEQVPSFIKSVLNKEGKSITPQALSFLAQNVSNVPSEIENEIEKLLLYIGEKHVIDERDVEEVIGVEGEGDIFDFLNAIGSRETGVALLFFSAIKQRGEPLLRVLSMIAEHLRLLWQTKIHLERGKQKATISQLLRIKSKRKMDALAEQSRLFSHIHLRRCFERMLNTDLSLKSMDPKVHPLLMELLILYITEEQ